MCGLVGIYSHKRDENLLKKTEQMLEIIHHRGPDQQGARVIDNVALGMVRLSVVDNEKHEIPYALEDDEIFLVYNGEIYNHLQLREELNPDNPYRNGSDTETLIYAYKEWGMDELLKKINGMFAIAIFDKKKNKLFLARDIAGEKNLYFIEKDEAFYFASEPKALGPFVNFKLNDDCLSYQAFEICCDRDTLFKDVFCPLPGEYITYDGIEVRKTQYWKVEEQFYHNLPVHEDDIAEKLEELVLDAIKIRTGNCAFEYGTLLSGGVDSSLLTAIAKPKYIFTLTYDQYNFGEDFNELKYAEMVAKSIDRELIIVRPKKEDFEEYREKIIYHLDIPCTWTSFNLFCILKEASKHVKVILSGEGVDELFGGYYRYHLLNHDEQIYQLKAMDKYFPLINKYYGAPSSRYAKLINRYNGVNEHEVKDYIEKLTANRFDPFENVVSGMGHTDFYTSMQVLLHMADRMSMAHSIENRAPFLDPRLISFAYSIPSKFKIKDGIAKYIFKKVASKYIPHEVAFREDKRGFVAPINLWYSNSQNKSDSPLKQYDRGFYKNLVFEDWKKVFNVGLS